MSVATYESLPPGATGDGVVVSDVVVVCATAGTAASSASAASHPAGKSLVRSDRVLVRWRRVMSSPRG